MSAPAVLLQQAFPPDLPARNASLPDIVSHTVAGYRRRAGVHKCDRGMQRWVGILQLLTGYRRTTLMVLQADEDTAVYQTGLSADPGREVPYRDRMQHMA